MKGVFFVNSRFDEWDSREYNGMHMDANTHMYNYGFRDYSPSTGRFTTLDPVKDSSNWYVLCSNDPVNKVDLLGLCEDGNEIVTEGSLKTFNALDMLGLSENVMGDGNSYGDWTRVSQAELDDMGLGDIQLNDSVSGFKSALYKNSSGKFTYAIAGSDDILGDISKLENVNDWIQNASQALGNEDTEQYNLGIDNVERILREIDRNNFHLTGHSLGGGIASAAATVYGVQATTYNAAGVHDDTLGKYGKVREDANGLVSAFYVKGEVLSHLQDNIGFIPEAIGSRKQLIIPGKDNDPLADNGSLILESVLLSLNPFNRQANEARKAEIQDQIMKNINESADRHFIHSIREALG